MISALESKLIVIVIGLLQIVTLQGCVSGISDNGRLATISALPDPHGHIIDVRKTWISDKPYQLEVSRVLIDTARLGKDLIANEDHSLQAFSTCREGSCHIYFKNVTKNEIFEIKLPPFSSGRPFSDLVWVTIEILVFDQWSTPHYGIHYAIDLVNKEVLLASPFTDVLPSDNN